MLSQKNIDTIKATIPVLEENGVALTRHFYDRMFRHNPEVKKFLIPQDKKLISTRSFSCSNFSLCKKY